MTDIAKGIRRNCPTCGHENKSHHALVMESGDILYKFSCAGCGLSYRGKVRGPVATVEPLTGFSSKPLRWEPKP